MSLSDAEILHRRELAEAQRANTGRPDNIDPFKKHKPPVGSYIKGEGSIQEHDNRAYLEAEALKLSRKWGFELESIEEPVEEVVEVEVARPEPIIEEQPLPTFSSQRDAYLEAGFDAETSARMSIQDIQGDEQSTVDEPVDNVDVEQAPSGDDVIARIAELQKHPVINAKELSAAISEAKSKGLWG